MNLDEIRRVLELAEEHSLLELEVEQEGIRLRIKRADLSPQASVSPVPVPELASTVAEPLKPVAEADTDDTSKLVVIKSPIVGTFFRAPDPKAKPFVEAGDTVGRGQVLCIIEAMKLMNEIDAEVDGEVVTIFVENGQPVQYGDQLFAIRP